MLPLMRMTWILNRRLLIGFSPVLAFYLAVLLKTQSMAEAMPRPFIACFIGIASLITLIITFQGLTLDVEGFLLSLPVSRAAVVRNKYLTSLLGLMAGIALPLATSWIGHLFAPCSCPSFITSGLRRASCTSPSQHWCSRPQDWPGGAWTGRRLSLPLGKGFQTRPASAWPSARGRWPSGGPPWPCPSGPIDADHSDGPSPFLPFRGKRKVRV